MIERIYSYEEKIKNSVEKTVNQIDKGDVVGQISYSQSVDFEHDKLQSIDDVSYSSVFCRLFNEGKVGNASINNPLNVEQLIRNATESARFGEKIDFMLPSAQEYHPLHWLYTEKNIQYSKKDLKDIAEELLVNIKKFAPKAKVSTGVGNYCSRFFLQNTNGFAGEYQCGTFSIYGGLFELAEDNSFLEMYESENFYENDYQLDTILTQLQTRIERSRQTSVLKKEGTMSVIIAPSSMDMILTPLEIASNGKTLYKDLSLFANKVDEQLFDSKFNFVDDPFYYHGSGSSPFDDEGVVGQKLSIIEKGVFKQFIYDCATAKKMGTTTTGHATRSSMSLPSPAFSNRIIGLGDHCLEEMIASVDYGLMLMGSLGEGQSNVIAGDFSVLAETAYLIEGGQLKGRVKDIMLSGNSFELLKNIPMIENKHYKEGSLITPHFLLDGIKVSKK